MIVNNDEIVNGRESIKNPCMITLHKIRFTFYVSTQTSEFTVVSHRVSSKLDNWIIAKINSIIFFQIRTTFFENFSKLVFFSFSSLSSFLEEIYLFEIISFRNSTKLDAILNFEENSEIRRVPFLFYNYPIKCSDSYAKKIPMHTVLACL